MPDLKSVGTLCKSFNKIESENELIPILTYAQEKNRNKYIWCSKTLTWNSLTGKNNPITGDQINFVNKWVIQGSVFNETFFLHEF